MPADRNATVGFAAVQLPAGTYVDELRHQCEQQCAPDPRLLFEPDFQELKAAGAALAAVLFDELLAAGEPIKVPGGHVGGLLPDKPDWLSVPAIYGGASLLWVYADDRCSPAEFYGDMSTVPYERIPVPPRHKGATWMIRRESKV
jgi:hypothetical protein